MRRRLAILAVAVTSLVVVAFVVPLGLLVRSQARDRALARGQREAQAVAAGLSVAAALRVGLLDGPAAELVLAASGAPEGVTVFLADGTTVGEAATSPHLAAARAGAAFTVDLAGGSEVLVPVSAAGDVVVVRAFVPAAAQRRGVVTAWLALAGLGAALIGAAVAIGDRLGRSVVGPVRDLADAAHRLGGGDLATRAVPAGPPEVAELGEEFNRLAARLAGLLAAERESIADLSHRLRTPLAALRLEIEAIPDAGLRTGLLDDLDRLENAVTRLIADARLPRREAAGAADLAAVVRHRAAFWRVLAEEQRRPMDVDVPEAPVMVGLSPDELGAVIDTLLENVFAHTDAGTPFRVAVDPARRTLAVEDGGPGLPAGEATRRGASGAGSTGLGLDIARRAAERSGGGLDVGRGPAGGATVAVRFGPPPAG